MEKTFVYLVLVGYDVDYEFGPPEHPIGTKRIMQNDEAPNAPPTPESRTM